MGILDRVPKSSFNPQPQPIKLGKFQKPSKSSGDFDPVWGEARNTSSLDKIEKDALEEYARVYKKKDAYMQTISRQAKDKIIKEMLPSRVNNKAYYFKKDFNKEIRGLERKALSVPSWQAKEIRKRIEVLKKIKG